MSTLRVSWKALSAEGAEGRRDGRSGLPWLDSCGQGELSGSGLWQWLDCILS